MNNKPTDAGPFRPRACAKSELALLYFPLASSPHVAVNHLTAWMRRCKPLLAELEAAGYAKTQKMLTPRQVEAIVRYLGEP